MALAVGVPGLHEDREAVLEHRFSHDRGALDLGSAYARKPSRRGLGTRELARQLARAHAELAGVDALDHAQSEVSARATGARDRVEERAAHGHDVIVGLLSERQRVALAPKHPEQCRRPQLGLGRTVEWPRAAHPWRAEAVTCGGQERRLPGIVVQP